MADSYYNHFYHIIYCYNSIFSDVYRVLAMSQHPHIMP